MKKSRRCKVWISTTETSWTSDEVPNMVGKNSGMSSLNTNNVKNTTNSNLILYSWLMHVENPCAKSFQITNVATIVIKLVNFVRSKGMNYHQFKDFVIDKEFKKRCSLLYGSSMVKSWLDA